MDHSETDDDWPIFAAFAGLAALALLYFLFADQEQDSSPQPNNSLVFGCYTTANGPPILLNQDGMHILQGGFPKIGFHLVRDKLGFALAAEAPIKAERYEGSYHYSINDRGVGLYLDFYKVINGKVYGVFEESELAGFRMLATDGRYLPYEEVDAANCGR